MNSKDCCLKQDLDFTIEKIARQYAEVSGVCLSCFQEFFSIVGLEDLEKVIETGEVKLLYKVEN